MDYIPRGNVHTCLKLCNDDKAPGPDGFNMKFLQHYWYVIKDDVMGIFHEMHETRKFVRALNSPFPSNDCKEVGAKNICDFRHVSLVGCIYKHIAKVLAGRLTKFLGKVIGDCQHVFVERRQI